MSSRHLQYMCHRSPGEKSGLEVNLGPVTMTEHLRMPAFNRQGQEEWRQDWRRQREWEFVAMVWATLPQEGTETTKEVHTQLKERKCNPRDDVIQVDSGVYSWDCIHRLLRARILNRITYIILSQQVLEEGHLWLTSIL